ncbi:hypothetical protein [Pedobacter deserti]|uniref:hypothetical protein n=1 Tax=Pedobacter deserti TaxID=2817382 RepID=UPI0021093DC0|nr:hypothetical protein [Pedobacter sp. SYSU D00382]
MITTTPPERRHGRGEVTNQEDKVVIAVRDFGPGVPEDKLKHILIAFIVLMN